MSNLNAPHFHDADAAREYLEAIRWPNGPFCPHCGAADGRVYRLEGKGGTKGTKARVGLLKCGECRRQFSVTVGTVFERSKIGLHKWLLASYLLCSSKKGISSHQLHRTLGVTYKTAWFMAHRIREAMRDTSPSPLGGEGASVEADETYIGGRARHGSYLDERGFRKKTRKLPRKEAVFALVERGGKVRSFHVARVNSATLRPILREQVRPETNIYTDEASFYRNVGQDFASHETVNHSIDEYVRGNASTNAIEGYFSILKRGINGIYQHVSPTHLKRYVGEFDFRFNSREMTDAERTDEALRGIEGKRLTYRQPREATL